MMKRTPLVLIAGILLTGLIAYSPIPTVLLGAPDSPRTAAAMASAAEQFLAGLTAEQRAAASFAFEDAERMRWNFIPGEMHPRRGLLIRDMSEAQRVAARRLLQSGLSARGYATANAVMELEVILRELEGPAGRFVRDPELYYFSIFGTPGATGAWGWRVEGHHLSLHFTVVDGQWVAGAPAFFGANPAEVREGPQRGTRILADREDVARQLVRSLDADQLASALLAGNAPNDILTGSDVDIEPLSPAGIGASALRPDQRTLLLSLIEVYAGTMTEDLAVARLAAIEEAGVDRITFAWAGGREPGERHYYRVQGPSFLIEYDNVQNDGNHIHAVWRDFDGDFGRDILREHLAAVPH